MEDDYDFSKATKHEFGTNTEFFRDLKESINFSPMLRKLMEDSPLRKIARIKTIREYSGLNLRSAKEIMDELNDLIPTFEKVDNREELEGLQQDNLALARDVTYLEATNINLKYKAQGVKDQLADLIKESLERILKLEKALEQLEREKHE